MKIPRRMPTKSAPTDQPVFPGFRLVSSWKGNLLIFGILIAIALGWFFWQVRYAQKTFTDHVAEQTRLLATVIKQHTDTSRSSIDVIEEIIRTFLYNSARFADFLNTVEPFSESELVAFAEEIGLAGIRIVNSPTHIVEGPTGWFPETTIDCPVDASLAYHRDADIYYLAVPGPDAGCVIVGFSAAHIRHLKEKIGIPNLIAALSSLPEIAYVRITPVKQDSAAHRLEPVVRFFRDDKHQLAEAHLAIDGHQLEVGVTATVFFHRLDQLWRQFFLFAALIAIFGGVLSWVWYRYQMEYVRRIQDYERHLAGEKEDAALGRASSTITHEIRNPLNAISMGLQRLKMEGTELSGEHQHLVGSLLNAVKRTNDIISDLKRYAGPIQPRRRKFDFTALVSDLVTLYKSNCRDKAILLTFASAEPKDIEGDTDLIAVVVENLIKNAVEAQPQGGEIDVRITEEHDIVRFSIENSGLDIAPDQLEQLFEPYFTTKTRGSGLGLAIVKRIVNAHNGRISLISPSPGRLRISVFLPKTGGGSQAVD
jgi:two-component system, NtrC family, sensor histidine kinase HydH